MRVEAVAQSNVERGITHREIKMNALILEEYRDLFRDQEAFAKFVEEVRGKLENDFSPILLGSEVLGAFVSPEAAKEVIYERIIGRIAKEPKLLDDIKDRLENDEIVDVDGF